jgi:hypothetical protein
MGIAQDAGIVTVPGQCCYLRFWWRSEGLEPQPPDPQKCHNLAPVAPYRPAEQFWGRKS